MKIPLQEQINDMAEDLIEMVKDSDSLEDKVSVFKVVTVWYMATLKPNKAEKDAGPPAGTFADLAARVNGEAHDE